MENGSLKSQNFPNFQKGEGGVWIEQFWKKKKDKILQQVEKGGQNRGVYLITSYIDRPPLGSELTWQDGC